MLAARSKFRLEGDKDCLYKFVFDGCIRDNNNIVTCDNPIKFGQPLLYPFVFISVWFEDTGSSFQAYNEFDPHTSQSAMANATDTDSADPDERSDIFMEDGGVCLEWDCYDLEWVYASEDDDSEMFREIPYLANEDEYIPDNEMPSVWVAESEEDNLNIEALSRISQDSYRLVWENESDFDSPLANREKCRGLNDVEAAEHCRVPHHAESGRCGRRIPRHLPSIGEGMNDDSGSCVEASCVVLSWQYWLQWPAIWSTRQQPPLKPPWWYLQRAPADRPPRQEPPPKPPWGNPKYIPGAPFLVRNTAFRPGPEK